MSTLPSDPPFRKLPANPSLEQLKKQAKELKRAASTTLAHAQFMLAGEYGFSSWAALKHFVESRPLTLVERIDRFIDAALAPQRAHRSGTLDRPRQMLEEEPRLATESIYSAVMSGELEAVQALLQADPELADRRGGPRDWEPLLYLCFSRFLRLDAACAARMVRAAEMLLAHGADPNAYWTDPHEAEGNRETPIYGAAGVANNRPLTKLLLAAGADPNDGETPYHSVEHDDVPCLPLLWEHFNEDSRSIAIQHKVDFPDAAGLRLLLELGADPNARRFFDRPPLHGCVFRGHDRELFEILLEFGADPNIADQSGRTPYALAARAGQQEIMNILVENGAMVDLKPTDRFLSACALGDAETVAAMLEETPDIVKRLDDDRTVICEVAANGNTTGVRTMLEAGFDVNTPGSVWCEGPIHRAAMGGHLDTVKLLYERGADLTMRDSSYSASPLGWGEHGGHDDIVDFLQRDASRLDLRDALEWGKTERVAELLGDTDVDAAIAGAEPGVLLRSAAYGGQLTLVAMLLEKGADRKLRNSEGMTALDYATRQGHAEVAELLRQEPKARRS